MDVPAGKGVLAIRDTDEDRALGSPTTITGTVDEDTGIISGATLSTPPVEFDTVALGFDVHVKATFSQVTPGGGTGLVNGDGKVVLRDTVRVTLDLDINDGTYIQRCEAAPVQLELLSTDVYSEENGGTIVDPSFTIPAVPVTDACIGLVADGVNDLLKGSGHSLSLFIKGDLPLPDPGEPTTTSLTVAPGGGSIRGTAVTLTATVAPTQAKALDPTGVVLFKDGTRTVGSAELAPDGTASLTTSELRPGDRSLTAEYQGDSDFAGSTSPVVPYDVAPAPVITGTFPEYVTRGAAPVEFDLTIDNTASPRPITNGRVDVAVPGLFAGSGLVLERQLPDTSWVPVALPFNGVLGMPAGTLGAATGTLVPAGAVQTHRLRVSAASTAGIRAARMEFTLVPVDPGSGESAPAVTSSSWPFEIVTATRVATTTTVGVYDTRIRPGQALVVDATVTTATGTATAGQVEFLIDGKVVPFRPETLHGPLAPTQTRATLDPFGYALGQVDVPADIPTGPHLVTARYLGTTSFLPSSPQGAPGEPDGPYVLQVIDPLGPLYTCDYVGLVGVQMGAYLDAYARLPAYAEDGEELDLEDVEVTVIPGGFITSLFLPNVATGGGAGVEHIEIDLGDAGTIEGDGLIHEPDDDTADQFLRLQNLEGTIVADGEPGDIMPLPINRISMSGLDFIGAGFTFGCAPQAEPVVLEEVGIAGVSLTAATATDPVRVGDEVVLTATVAPALSTGLVEFFSGSESLGTASGAMGTASLAVDDLPAGANFLVARYTGVPGSPYQSEVVELDVLPAVECTPFAESGHGATVRLVYLELLGRCPDQGGFDYWKGRLAGGTSASVFARSIAGTPEAVGRVVDDAYQTMLGRAPDAAGRAFWVKRLQASGRYDGLLADLGASGEFWAKSGSTNSGFVTRVYDRLLNRAPDAGGLDYWVGRLDAGASRRALVLSLANQSEPLGRLVAASYDEILGRAPSTSERTDGIGFLRSTGDRSALYAELIGDAEFATRAQGFPNPED